MIASTFPAPILSKNDKIYLDCTDWTATERLVFEDEVHKATVDDFSLIWQGPLVELSGRAVADYLVAGMLYAHILQQRSV